MKIFLPKLAKQGVQHAALTLNDRLPSHIPTLCELTCDYEAEAVGGDYFLLHLKTKGIIQVACQRCLQIFPYEYLNETQLAICEDDRTAEEVMQTYECVVTLNYHIDLTELLTDELHLYLPEKHPNPRECDKKMNAFVQIEDDYLM